MDYGYWVMSFVHFWLSLSCVLKEYVSSTFSWLVTYLALHPSNLHFLVPLSCLFKMAESPHTCGDPESEIFVRVWTAGFVSCVWSFFSFFWCIVCFKVLTFAFLITPVLHVFNWGCPHTCCDNESEICLNMDCLYCVLCLVLLWLSLMHILFCSTLHLHFGVLLSCMFTTVESLHTWGDTESQSKNWQEKSDRCEMYAGV